MLVACTKGPLKQVSQSRNAGSFFNQFSERIVENSQLVTNGRYFFYGTRFGNIYCIDSTNLHRKWKKEIGAGVDTSVFADQDRIYVGTSESVLHALDAKNGKPIWSANLSAPPRGEPLKIGSVVVVGNNDGVLEAFHAENGQSMWKYRQETYEKMKIQFFVNGVENQNRLYVGFPNGQLSALDLQTGAEIWKLSVANPQSQFYDVSSILLVPQKGLLVTSVEGASTMFSFDGQQLWSYANTSTQAPAILLDDQILIAAKDRLVILDFDGNEKAAAVYSRTIRPAGVAYADGNIYVSTMDGKLHVFHQQDLTWTWEYKMGVSIQGAPVIMNHRIYILNRGGQIISMATKK